MSADDLVRILSDREFIDSKGEPVVTSNAAYQEILLLREHLADCEARLKDLLWATSLIRELPMSLGHRVQSIREQADWTLRAIATEARRAATGTGAVHEGAGPQDIAQGGAA